MERDFENVHDLDDLSDDELREVVKEHLAADHTLDAAEIIVRVEDGVVHLSGRVGTEEERRVAEHVVTDVLGIEQLEDELVVDPIRRAESPEAIDDHLVDEEEHAGLLLGDRPVPLADTAEHLDEDEDAQVRAFGSTDIHKAIEKGEPWVPPSSPTPEGLPGESADPEDMASDH